MEVSEERVKELIDKKVPYSDMTDEEIEAVVSWKNDMELKKKEAEDRLNTMVDEVKLKIDVTKEAAKEAQRTLDSLVARLMGDN